MKLIPRCALVLAALVCLVPAAGRVFAVAAPLADRVPADATVYVGWAGLDRADTGYAGSKLAKLVQALRVKSMVDSLVQSGLDPDSPLGPKGRDALKVFQDLDGAYLDRPWAMYIKLPEDLDKLDKKPPLMRFMIEPGEDRPAITRALKMLRDQMTKEKGKGMVAIQTGDDQPVLSLTIRPDLARSSGPPARPLSRSDRFAAALGDHAPGSLLTEYGDLDGLAQRAADQPDVPPRARAVMEELGLMHLRSWAGTAGFDGQGRFISHFALRTDGQPALVLKLLGGKPLTRGELKLAPKTAVWVRAMRFDVGAAFDAVEKLLKAHAPAQAKKMDRALALASSRLGEGIDLRSDVIHALGKLVVLYADRSLGSAMVGVNAGAAVPLDKPQRLKAVLAAAYKWIKANQPANTRGRVSYSKQNLGGIDVYALHSAQVNFALAVDGGRLYITKLASSIPAMADQGNADDSILDNPAFQRVRRAVGMKGATSFVFVDLPKTAPGYYTAIRMGLGMMSMVLHNPRISRFIGMLPPLSVLQDQLTPAGWASRITPTGWVQRSVDPFPGAATLSPEAATSGGALTVGILLPALGAARRTARQLQTSTQARGIHQACVTYAEGNRDASGVGYFPPDLATLYHQHAFTIEYIISPMSGTSVPDDFKRWSKSRQDAWIRKNASYVLVPNLTDDFDSNKIALFLKPKDSGGGGITVTYNDNSTEWVTDVGAIRAKLKKQTGKTMDQLIAESERGGADQAPGTPPGG